MKIVVLGATGTIGKAVLELLQSKGHEVIAASRSTNPSVNITDPVTIEQFYEQIGEVDAIVSVAGEAAFVPVDKLTDDQIQLSVNSKLLGQINMVRKGLSRLRPNGVAVITGGFLAYNPAPQTAMIAMVNAGLEGFTKAAALDLTQGCRILIVHPPWVAETAAALGMDPAPWPNAAETAQAYLTAVESTKTGEAIFVEGYAPAGF
ncbi:short chain dehydrogenase [Adhaeribacter rhizoryzae]|uniref:Short chain dehydrogenase n=1 Tax=Adhaeribacter rhizoryzae TaxID=2607907 RepID=A0A5M6D6Z9_9BACT|nr:short chain dehydrogenase [Adhaeribacter rhizoryzae]KAA5543324.1 short chain dehydrogenase [Adhaeribacter rhizoryzae]